ncbi:MAG: DNA repair protein RadA [Bdellovibrionales bacterium]|nr:DNA repair protein RadA [Bdellovibrionales bacterium]
MKTKTQYTCQNCGNMSPKWLGKCPECGSWNSFVEEKVTNNKDSSIAAVRESFQETLPGSGIVKLNDESRGKGVRARIPTGSSELDRVLGGGMIRDGFVLIGGDPGIGKSTLLLQVTQASELTKVLYVSGEESIGQIQGRANRLKIKNQDRIYLAAETQLEKVLGLVKELKPDLLIMDSLQTFSTGFVESAPGTVSQVREVTSRLMNLAKSAGLAVWLVGHVTKDGAIAGPKIVEHLVDTVLYFEGDSGQTMRLLRTVKNRFGNTNELGVFEMTSDGLVDVANPSALFLSERAEPAMGTAIVATIEGSRPLLVELQALCVPSPYGTPRRTSVGMDSQKVALLTAVLEKHVGTSVMNQDLFFNVAGGLRLSEPACDLASMAAILSAILERPIPSSTVFLGEVGLTGEVRKVPQIESRVDEAKKLGFKVAVVPHSQMERATKTKGIQLIPIHHVSELKKALS